ncbi:MAG: 23S rRNA (adenine(2503)-C(2))-methyltransferase RlmN [bacterium]
MNLKDCDLDKLRLFVESIGEKPYRAQQLFKWLYGKGVFSFDEMSDLSKALREKLRSSASIRPLKLISLHKSKQDDSKKFLFELADGNRIETVLMFDDRRTTLCVSTQVGCAIDCKFCATALMGLQRHLSSGEIVDQFLSVQKAAEVRISNVVFMGMGEPFHNYENVIKASRILSDACGPNLARRHLVISTSGVVPKIMRFADEGHGYRLAISLNATTNEVRSRLMPLNKKWPIGELLNAARYYIQKTKQQVTFEYVLMAGINDSLEDAHRLKTLLSDIFCKVNLIPYNATVKNFRRPGQNNIEQFFAAMSSLKAPVTIRWSKGEDIAAACGQLATSEAVANPAAEGRRNKKTMT